MSWIERFLSMYMGSYEVVDVTDEVIDITADVEVEDYLPCEVVYNFDPLPW